MKWGQVIVAPVVIGIAGLFAYGWGAWAVRCEGSTCAHWHVDWASLVTGGLVLPLSTGMIFVGLFYLLGAMMIAAGSWFLHSRGRTISVLVYAAASLAIVVSSFLWGVRDAIVNNGPPAF